MQISPSEGLIKWWHSFLASFWEETRNYAFEEFVLGSCFFTPLLFKVVTNPLLKWNVSTGFVRWSCHFVTLLSKLVAATRSDIAPGRRQQMFKVNFNFYTNHLKMRSEEEKMWFKRLVDPTYYAKVAFDTISDIKNISWNNSVLNWIFWW